MEQALIQAAGPGPASIGKWTGPRQCGCAAVLAVGLIGFKLDAQARGQIAFAETEGLVVEAARFACQPGATLGGSKLRLRCIGAGTRCVDARPAKTCSRSYSSRVSASTASASAVTMRARWRLSAPKGMRTPTVRLFWS